MRARRHAAAADLDRDLGGVAVQVSDQHRLDNLVEGAFLLDHVQTDLELMSRINQLLRDGEALYGEEFVHKLSQRSLDRGTAP